MVTQGLLFASKEDAEIQRLESAIIAHNSKFAELPETKRKFVIHWLTRSEKDRMEDIASRVGISKTKAYELAKNSDVGDNLIIACQVIGRQTDMKASIGHDMIAESLYNSIRKGVITHSNISSIQLRILEKSKERLGMTPAIMQQVKVSDGNVTAEVNTIQGNSALTELLERQDRTEICDVEGEFAESVQ